MDTNLLDTNLLDELLATSELSNYYFLVMISLRLTAVRMQRILARHGDAAELDELVLKRNALLATKRLIDYAVLNYFASDGRIN